jgi:hypothetical protein
VKGHCGASALLSLDDFGCDHRLANGERGHHSQSHDDENIEQTVARHLGLLKQGIFGAPFAPMLS